MLYFLKCLNTILQFFDFNIFTFANILSLKLYRRAKRILCELFHDITMITAQIPDKISFEALRASQDLIT